MGCGIGCGSAALVLLLVALFLFARVTAKPPGFPRAAPTPTAQPSAGAPGIPTLEEQTKQIKQAVESNQQVQVSLRMTEAQLNDYIARHADPNAPIRNLSVDVREGHVVLMGTTTWMGRSVYLTVGLAPQVVGGRLAFQITSAQVGNIGLPGPVVQRLQSDIDRAMAQSSPVEEGVYLDGIEVTGGEIALSGHTVPR